MEAFSPRRRLSTIAILPIPKTEFHVLLNPDAYPTSRFGKSVRCDLTTPMNNFINKWESAGLMDGCYVVGIGAIPYPKFGVLINIVFKEDITYRVTIGDMRHCTCPDCTKMSSQSLRKEEISMDDKHLYYVFGFLCKVDYDSDKFMYGPTYSYNEVMWLLELAGVVKCE